MTHHTFPQPTKDDLIREALRLLVKIDPRMAKVLWLYIVVGMTEEDIAKQLRVTVETIRRWLNGYTRHDGKYIWGAKDWLANILDLYLEATRYGLFEEVKLAFLFAEMLDPSDKQILVRLLVLLWEALDADFLKVVLASLREARGANCYDRIFLYLLDLSGEDKLCRFFIFFTAGSRVCPGSADILVALFQ